MSARTNSLNLRPRKHPLKQVSRRDGIVDSFRRFQSADNLDLDVIHCHLFPDGDTVVLSLQTGKGTATFCMSPRLAHDIGDGLMWLAEQLTPAQKETV